MEGGREEEARRETEKDEFRAIRRSGPGEQVRGREQVEASRSKSATLLRAVFHFARSSESPVSCSAHVSLASCRLPRKADDRVTS